ncbi:MAG: 30S ribosomal protein S20 [Patescibacteria group bacterium]
MPIIHSAKKKLRQDKVRTTTNQRTMANLKKSLKAVKREPTTKHFNEAIRALDTAAKKGIIHANKAARFKSRLAKQTRPMTSKPAAQKSRSKVSESKA